MTAEPSPDPQTSQDAESTDPLAGLLVIDLSTTVPGQQAAQFLADAGADVIQVEPPGGVPTRTHAAWPALARGKRSVVLDLATPEDNAVLTALIRRADVLMTTFDAQAAERLGLSPTRLAGLNPRLISASVTGFGSSGPWQASRGTRAWSWPRAGFSTRSGT